MTLEMLILGIAAFGAVISAIFAVANFLRRPPSRDALVQLLRAETDIVKKAGDDQARGLRQDLPA